MPRVVRSSRSAVVVAAMTVVALVLRLPGLRQSYFGDELFTYEVATRSSLHAVLAGVHSDLEITPPLFFVVAWVFQKVGDPFLWMRLPSLLAGVATVPLVYLLGLRTVGRRAAVVGAGLFTLSPMAIFYATEARAYALMTMLLVLSTLALLRAMETNQWHAWAVFGLLEAGALYTHYTAIFVLGTQAAWGLCTRRALLRQMALAHLGAALLYLPWSSGLQEDRSAPAQKVMAAFTPFTLRSTVEHLERFVAGGPFAPLGDLPGRLGLALLASAAAVAVVGVAWRRARAGPVHIDSRVALVGLLALAAPVGEALYSTVGDDLLSPRNLMSSLPALALAFAALVTALPRMAMAITLALVTASLGLGAVKSFEPSNQRPAYGDVADFVNAEARPGDVVLELGGFPGPPGRALEVHLDPNVKAFKVSQVDDALRAAAVSGGRIFYVRPEVPNPTSPGPAVLGSYRATQRRTWTGLVPLTVVVFTPMG